MSAPAVIIYYYSLAQYTHSAAIVIGTSILSGELSGFSDSEQSYAVLSQKQICEKLSK